MTMAIEETEVRNQLEAALRERFGTEYHWTDNTFTKLVDTEFFMGEIGGESVLLWPGYEKDAEMLLKLLFFNDQNEVIQLADISDGEFRDQLYGRPDPIDVHSPPDEGPIVALFTRTDSVFAQTPRDIPEKCQLLPLQHMVITPGVLDTSMLQGHSYVRLGSRIATTLHDSGKVIDSMNGDHDTISAEMARTLLIAIQHMPNPPSVLTDALVQDVVAVVGLHDLVVKTVEHSVKKAALCLDSEVAPPEVQRGVTLWKNMQAEVATMLQGIDSPVGLGDGGDFTHHVLFNNADVLEPVILMLQSQVEQAQATGLAMTQVGYAHLAKEYDALYATRLLDALQTLICNFQRIQILYLVSLADLRASDRPTELLEKFRQEVDTCILAIILSLNHAYQTSSQHKVLNSDT